jgi:hypothetical protein
MKGLLHLQSTWPFLAKFLPVLPLGVSAGNCQRVLVDESGLIKSQRGKAQSIRNWSRCMGCLA